MKTNKKDIRCNQDIINYLIPKNISLISDYINCKTKIICKCNFCNYTWLVLARQVARRSGCPKCAGNIKLTNEDIDKRIINKFLERLEDVKNNKEKIKFKCLNCNYIWMCCPSSIINNNNKNSKKTGCPNCSNCAKLTNEKIDERLKDRNIKKLEVMTKYNKKIKFKCLKCDYIWSALVNSVLNKKTGCGKCAKVAKIDLEIFINRSNNIHNNKFDYSKVSFKNTHSKIKIICPTHGEFEQKVSSHLVRQRMSFVLK